VSAKHAALNRWMATDKLHKKVASRGSVVAQAPSDLRQEFLGTDTHGAMCFQGCWKEIVGPAERAVLCDLSGSCSLSGTALVMALCWRLAFPDVSTTVTSQVALRPDFPRQQCQTIGPLAVVTNNTVWFPHAADAGSSQRTPDDVV